MKILGVSNYNFTPKILMLLLTLIAVTLLSSLGCWQLRRADEKRAILNSYAVMQQQPVRDILSFNHPDEVIAYQPLSAAGNYDNQHQILLDNQYNQHQLGYQVLTPLILANGKVLLINRGWIKANLNRAIFPIIPAVTSSQLLTGTVYFPSAKAWVFGNVMDNPGHWPLRIEKIDTQQLAKLLGRDIYSFTFRLNKNQNNGFIRDWKLVIMMPSRHIAYAVQWFLMAMVVVIIFIGLNLERKNDS